MVIGHDFPAEKDLTKPKQEKQSLFVADPADRLAAFVVDMMVLLPLIKVFCGKLIVSLKITLSFHLLMGFLSALFVLLWTGFSVFLIYKVVSITVFGKTLGQYFFKIRIRNFDGESRVEPHTLILRSLLSFVSILSFFPLISVFTDRKGRTFYDKICGTLVVSTKENGVLVRNTQIFHKLIGSVFILNLILIFSLVSLYLSGRFYDLESDISASSKICEQVSSHHNQWDDDGVYESRLEVALALFSASKISSDCLKQEISFELSLNNQSPLAHLAKGFLEVENDAVALEYFRKACELNSQSRACEVVLWVNSWPEPYEGEQRNDFETLPTYSKIWTLKRNYAKGNVAKFYEDLKDFDVHTGLENFYAEMKFKVAKYLSSTSESQDMIKVLSGTNSASSSFNEKICAIMLSDGCAALAHTNCSRIEPSQANNEHVKNMLYACQGKKHNIVTQNPALLSFYNNIQEGESVDSETLKLIYSDPNYSIELRMAALNKGFSMNESLQDFYKMLVDWHETSRRDYVWRVWGETLLSHLQALGEGKEVFKIYRSLAKEFDDRESFSPKTLKRKLSGEEVPLPESFRQPATKSQLRGK